jgi:hypothetical protein
VASQGAASPTTARFAFAHHFAAQTGRRTWAIYSFLTGLAIPVFSVAAFNAWLRVVASDFCGVFQRLALDRVLDVDQSRGP